MNDAEKELVELHRELAVLYKGKSTDWPQIKRYWARIEKLEATL